MNLFENLQVMHESEEVKTFNISFKKDGVYQANLIKGYNEEQVTEFYANYKPEAEIIGVKLATNDDMKPGKPVIDATKEIVKEADKITDDPAWDDTFDEVPVFEAEYAFNGKRLDVTLTEEEEFINVHINDNVYLQEPKEVVNNDNDLEYLAFTTAVEYYKELKFADKIEEAAILKDDKDLEKVVEATELRTMSGTDIYAWQGAADFKDGSKPLIADGEYATMIVSGPDSSDSDEAMIGIYFGDENEHWAMSTFISKEKAIKYAKMLLPLLNEEIDDYDLKRFGFEIVA